MNFVDGEPFFDDPDAVMDFGDGTSATVGSELSILADDFTEDVSTLRQNRRLNDLAARYKGKVVSRATLLQNKEDESENLLSDESDQIDNNKFANEDDEDDEIVRGELSSSVPTTTTFSDDIAAKLASLRAEDATNILGLKAATEDRAAKAKHGRNQRALWESFLEYRIRMQPLLKLANRFPSPRSKTLFVRGDSTFLHEFDQASHKINSSLNIAVKLQGLLLGRLPRNMDETYINKGNSCSGEDNLEKLWTLLDERWKNVILPYTNRVIDHFGRKVQLDAGGSGGGLHKKKLELVAFNRTMSQQIAGVLSDHDRLLKRSRKRRGEFSIIGENIDSKSVEKQGENFQIYDDGDFYGDLLTELLESDGNNSSSLGNRKRKGRNVGENLRPWKRYKSLKKTCDRKASKGRKVRYVTHPKLLNFMAPIEELPATIDSIRLFNSLFGQHKIHHR
eukprot:g1086.t1